MAKRALLVGINAYPDPRNALRGCVNDVKQMLRVLVDHFGFAADTGVRTLTDTRATTAAITAGLRWLVGGTRPGDVLVFHYSGHGSQVPDRHGDEGNDGLDEIICPYDLDWNDPFTDDDLHAIVGGVPAGANLAVVLDCCHSGTGLRERRADSNTGLHAVPKCIQLSGLPEAPLRGRVRRFGRRTAEEGAILLAACRDGQVSADAFIDGDYHGAHTFYLCQAVGAAAYDIMYGDLVRRIRALLREGGFEQAPQLEGAAGAARLHAFQECKSAKDGGARVHATQQPGAGRG